MTLLAITNFNIVTSVLGGWITLVGLFSYLLKERYYLSEACISFFAGIAFTHVAKLLKPSEYAGSKEDLDAATLDFSRLVLGVQLVLVGVQLPSRYLQREWKSLALLLGPGMVSMWACSSILIWALVPKLPFLHALAIGACVTPTDPVLSNSIVKGKFADENVPRELRHIIIAESGANDGLGYPFLFFALYLIKYTTGENYDTAGGASTAIALFLGQTCGYVVLLSIVYGGVVGWTTKRLLHWAEKKKFVDRESFLIFPIALALFIVGTCGMIGSDDVLACFIAGNAFTWDDWFRLETLDDSLQPTVDMLLNMAMFMWLGATCPWESFWTTEVILPHRLMALGILVLLLRRLPMILSLHRHIRQITDVRQAFFVGYFGPIGVSAIFYLYVGLEFLKTLAAGDVQGADTEQLAEAMTVIIWFLIVLNVVVHGLSVPLGKLGFYLSGMSPRPISLPL
ncbi:Na/H antiporter [Xylariaceae sp. FL1651]|nr:Na/H antiporter [Xylariaceae sp. FL1651]